MPRGVGGEVGMAAPRLARFQPLLLTGTILGYLPFGLRTVTDPADRRVLVAGGTLLLVGSVGAWWWHRRHPTSGEQRAIVALGLGLLTLTAFVSMLAWADLAGVTNLLAYALLLSCAFALTPITWIRLTVQATVLLAVGARLAVLGLPPARLALVLGLLAVTTGIVDVFAADLATARAAQRRARADADVRARLLETVAQLPLHEEVVADERATRALTALGIGALTVRRLPAAAEPDDGATDGPGEGVPIRVGGVERGRVAVADAPAPLDPAQRELVTAVATHIGRSWETRDQHLRQQQRLQRMTVLEGTRRAFLDDVSEELRAPLRTVHGAVARLREPSGPAGREDAAATLAAAADELRAGIEVLLDVSRLQLLSPAEPDRTDHTPLTPVTLSELLTVVGPRCEDVEVAVPADTRVLVAPRLLRHALELWLAGSTAATCRLVVTGDPAGICLERHRVVAGGVTDAGAESALVTRLAVAAGARWCGREVLLLPRAVEPGP